jgi:hypothetical protein
MKERQSGSDTPLCWGRAGCIGALAAVAQQPAAQRRSGSGSSGSGSSTAGSGSGAAAAAQGGSSGSIGAAGSGSNAAAAAHGGGSSNSSGAAVAAEQRWRQLLRGDPVTVAVVSWQWRSGSGSGSSSSTEGSCTVAADNSVDWVRPAKLVSWSNTFLLLYFSIHQ